MKQPSYIQAFESGKLQNVADKLWNMLESCQICPRRCKINRLNNEKGFCKTGLKAQIYSFMLHHGEEPPISGVNGSGTIFFANCNMACVYCQNFEFSQLESKSKEVDSQELAKIMLDLQYSGAHNINFVSPTHVLPQILQALVIAVGEGLKIPLVYNTNGYESVEIVKLLDGIIDIYLPDMRYFSTENSFKFSFAKDYSKFNFESVKEMFRQVGNVEIDDNDILVKGLIIRHLVLPNDISGTRNIMEFIAHELSSDVFISLMSQYMPLYKANNFTELNRRLYAQEYDEAKNIMESFGLFNGWVQESGGLDRFAGTNIKPVFDDEGKNEKKQ